MISNGKINIFVSKYFFWGGFLEEVKTVKEHLNELKKRFLFIVVSIIVCFFIIFLLSESIILFLINYYGLELFVLSPLEFIRTQLKLSFLLTIAFLIPFLLVQVYLFASPMLNEINKKNSIKYFFISFFLAFIGFIFGVFFFSNYSLGFFANLPDGVSAMWGIYSSVNFIMFSGFAFALVAQLIIIIPVLVKLDLIKIEILQKSRSIFIIVSLIISALLTSPDPVTQILMAVPMYACFETGLIISKFQLKLKRFKNK